MSAIHNIDPTLSGLRGNERLKCERASGLQGNERLKSERASDSVKRG